MASSSSNILTLPSYAASFPPPDYSSHRTPAQTGKFTKTWGSVSLVLLDQENGAAAPSYSQQASVRGHIALSKSEAVSEVKLKVGILYPITSLLTNIP